MNKSRPLPKINLGGVNYFVDFDMEEIRPINAPFLAIYFDDLSDADKAEIRGVRAREWHNCYIQSLDN